MSQLVARKRSPIVKQRRSSLIHSERGKASTRCSLSRNPPASPNHRRVKEGLRRLGTANLLFLHHLRHFPATEKSDASAPLALPTFPLPSLLDADIATQDPLQHSLLRSLTTMQARNAAGRQVSLLNDDSSSLSSSRPTTLHQQRPVSFHSASHVLSRPYPSPRSNSSSPNTPELLRSDSYDSQMSNDPISPLTPSVDYAYPRGALYPPMDAPPAKRPGYAASSRATSFDDDSSAQSAMADQRPSKRYPCRYRDSHGCEKTFTTSGHASRHSKIHTAEKAVQCTFHGCQKKFTRADNMKQHLETHYKDKSRSSGVARVHKAALNEARRGPSRTRPSLSTSNSARDATRWDAEQHQRPLPSPPLASPTSSAAWDMRSMNLPLLSRPTASRTPSTGLDALAMAVACQEGGS